MFLLLCYFPRANKLFVREISSRISQDQQCKLYESIPASFSLDSSEGVLQLRHVSISNLRTISDFKRSIVRHDVTQPDYKTVPVIAF